MSRSNAVASSSRHRLSSPSDSQEPNGSRRERKPFPNGSGSGANGDIKPPREEEDEAEDDDDDPSLRWNIDNFVDVPVGDDAVGTIRHLKSKLQSVSNALEEGIRMGTETACQLELAKEDHPEIPAIQKSVMTLIDRFNMTKMRIDVGDSILHQINNTGAIENIQELFRSEVEKFETEYNAKTARQKYKEDDRFNNFCQTIWDINHPEEARPPITNWLPREEGDDEDDDSDIEVGGRTQNFRCPLTMMPFEHAMTNTVCGHSYSRDAIYEHIDRCRRDRVDAKCPHTGCRGNISRQTLREDKDLQTRSDRATLRQKQRAEAAADEDDYLEIDSD